MSYFGGSVATIRQGGSRPSVDKWLGLAALFVNVAGIIVYLLGASEAWLIPQEMGLNSMTGEPLVWGLVVLPVYGLFLVVNLIWGGFILRKRQWRTGRLWLCVGLMWLVAIAIDFAHH